MAMNERAVPDSALAAVAGRLAAVQRMTDALVRAAPLEEVYDEALAALRVATEADRASVLVFDDAGVMRFVAWHGLSSAYRQAVDGHSPWRPDSAGATTLVVEDAQTDASLEEYRDVILGEGIRALVFVPMVYGSGVLGKFMLYFAAPRRLGPEEIRLAETIVGHVTVAIVRERTEEALKQKTQQFETLAEHAPDVIARFDRELRHLYVNPVISEMAGVPRDAYIGRTNAELGMPLEIVERWTSRLHAAFETGQPQRFEFSFPGVGGIRQFESQVRPEAGENGAIESVLSVTREVTKRWKAERTMRLLARTGDLFVATLDSRAALKRFAALLTEDVADGCRIDLLDEAGEPQTVAVSATDYALRDALATKPVGAPGTADAEPWHMEVPDGVRAALSVPLAARSRVFGSVTLVAPRGSAGYDADDVALVAELCERAALAVENVQLYEDAVAANRVKSAFLATMSHELRTPLNAILGYADLLQLGIGGALGALQHEQIGRIQASSRHLLTLIEGLLTFSRLEAGTEQARREPVDVVALVSEAVALVGPAALAKQLALTMSSAVPSFAAETDPGKLLQILLNLLGNAVKFTDTGTVEADVAVAGDDVVISVRDTGRGIAAEHLERVFEPFWQAEQGTTRRSEGAGLGLAVSRQLAELLSADLDLTSTPGAGSVFTLRLPAKGAAPGTRGEE